MLIEFSVTNFYSIREEVRLSLVASTGKELYDTNVTKPLLAEGVKNIPLLRSAALYGPNAGGKSNLMKALAMMQRIVMTSIQDLENLPVTPFKLSPSTIEKPTVFETTILADKVRYQYGFSATSEKIHEEWLFAFPKGRTQTWFKRTLNTHSDSQYEYTFGDKLTGDKDVWKRATRSNALFLSTAIQLNSQQLQPVFNWFANKLRIAGIGGWSPHFSIEWCRDDKKKDEILNFLKAADFAVSDVHVNEEDLSSESIPSDLPNPIQKFLEHELQDKKTLHLTKTHLTTTHQSESGERVAFDFDEESDGTQKMFGLAGPWQDSLSNGHVLFIDELGNNLHPLLVKFLVQLFHSDETNQNFAQLVFSTHETSILSQDVFRRDQIWFCEQAKSQGTKLFPLTEFSPRKDIENLERAYLSGRYGALPFLHAVSQNFEGYTRAT